MKRVIIFLFSSILSFSVQCQDEKPITKGNLIIGGSGSLILNINNNVDDSGPYFPVDGTSLNLNPSFAYFVVNNLALGLLQSTVLYFDGGYKSHSLGVGPTISYYLDNGFFSRVEAIKSYEKGDISKSTSAHFNIGVGFAAFINRQVSLEPVIKFNNSNTDITTLEQTVGQVIIPEAEYNFKWSYLSFELGFNIFW